MNTNALWSHIESRLESQLPSWRTRVDELHQFGAVEDRTAGRTWSDDEVFEALLLAVLSSNTDWSKIERVRTELSDLFSGFSLKSYAALSKTDVGDRFLPWFTARKAGSMTLRRNLVNLIDAARILLKYRATHGTADGYFTSLIEQCDGDPKLAALRLGCHRTCKLPSLGVPLAAETLKNLGFDVAKPDRHVMRAVGSFGLVHFGRWTDAGASKNGFATPVPTPRRQLLAMKAVQDIAEGADKRVVVVDNAIWLLCAKSELHLTNQSLAEMASEHEPPYDHAEGLGNLIQLWMDEESTEEQRETLEHLVHALDEDRLSDRKLFPEELKGKSW